jgi:hypothetical protein
MTTDNLQVQIFRDIKSKLPGHLSMVEEIASLLGLSTDSAYRRIRGEKPLNLEEVCKLCAHYKISLDQSLNLAPEGYVFSGNFVQPSSFRFDQWLKAVMQQVGYMSSFREKKMYYLLKDIPIFHHFHFREVAAFKHYVWMKGIFNAPEFANRKFSLKDYPDEIFELGRKALSIYNTIDSTEIWNIETINSTMRQIDYYHDSNLFEHEEEVMVIYDALEQLLIHLDKQAEKGYKFTANQEPPANGGSGSYEMYLNEMVIGDNSVLAILDGAKVGFIIHTVMNVMTTRDMRFCDNMYDSIQSLVRRSTLISSVSERERARFFRYLRKRIASRREKVRG